MSRTVHCTKLGRDLPGLSYPPMQGELGQRIYDEISEEAWQAWVRHSTMVLNELRLNPTEEGARAILSEQLRKFLFGEESASP